MLFTTLDITGESRSDEMFDYPDTLVLIFNVKAIIHMEVNFKAAVGNNQQCCCQSENKTTYEVAYNEQSHTPTYCYPTVDYIDALKSEQTERLLQTTIKIVCLVILFHHFLISEEHWQCFCCCYKENTCTNNQHDGFFDILFFVVHLDIHTDSTC